MKYPMQKILLAGVLLVATAAIAKLPAVSDEAKAKAAEAVKAIEAARPDAEKLFLLAKEAEEWTMPEMSSDAGRSAMAAVVDANKRFAVFIRKTAESLTK